jgi:Ca2+/Na+ antiporter
MNHEKFSLLFKLSLLITLILSFYIFIRAVFFEDNDKKRMFNAWQFPMLLALYIDAVYILTP